jgi:hypothetical protein
MVNHLKNTIMVDFIATILEIEKQFGPFDAAMVIHWGMSVIKCKKKVCKICCSYWQWRYC